MTDVETSVTSTERKSSRKMMWIGIIAAVIVILIIASFVLMINAGVTGTVRDVIIIFLALESVAIATLMIVLVVQVIGLVTMLREEVKPLLQSAQDTLEATRGTTAFVSQKVITPVIKVAGTVAGVKSAIKFLIKRK
jgi:amino acid permease